MSAFNKILKYYLSAAIMIISVISSGCDQVDIIEPVNLYKNNVVVRAELVANEKFGGVTFTKTLPVGQAYSLAAAELNDVDAYIKVDGTQVIPLHYTGNGLYKPLYDYTIKPGSYYELFAKHLGEAIYSKTYVPDVPVIDKVIYRSDLLSLQGEVNATTAESFGASWIFKGGSAGEEEAGDFYSIETIPQSVGAGRLTVRSQVIPAKYRYGGLNSKIYMKIYAFDRAYQRYFQTRDNGKPVEDSFIHGGDNIGWNVDGKNAIGLFIGYAVSEPVAPN